MNDFIMPPYGRKESFNIVRDIILSDDYYNPVIVEIGMTRVIGNWLGDGYSTPFFAYLVNVRKGDLYSIDIDPDAERICTSILNTYGLYTDRVHLVVEDGISFLESWQKDLKKPIDLLYLDGWDYGEGSLAIISEESHLKAFQAVENSLSIRALILIDDVYDTVTFKGKGRLVIPYIIQRGYKPLYLGYQCLFSKSDIHGKPSLSSLSFLANTENIINEITREAREESLQEGSTHLPRNFGDILLQNESRDTHTKTMLANKRADGVRDDDIRWWWNMNDIQRRMTIKFDHRHKQDEFRKLTKEHGLHEEEAKIIIRKTQPVFNESDTFFHAAGEDRPLPFELIGRINKYIKMLQSDPEKYKTALKASSSFNAFIRGEIRKGNL